MKIKKYGKKSVGLRVINCLRGLVQPKPSNEFKLVGTALKVDDWKA